MNNARNPFNEFFKMYGDFKSPTMDINSLFAIGRRNAEAMSTAGTVMAESMQHASRRQAENVRCNVEEILKVTKDMMGSGSPEINTAKQAELAKMIFEGSLQNYRELSEAVTKSVFEASDLLNRRASESFEELSNLQRSAA